MTTKSAIIYVVLFSMFAYVHSDCMDADGRVHADGTGSYIGSDGCNTCFCMRGMSVCTRMYCLPGHRRCMGTDGTLYSQGDSFKSSDGCNTCTCTDHGVSCTEMACLSTAGCTDPVTGKLYQVGQSFQAADGCNTCYCSADGSAAACTEMACLDG